MQGIGSPFSTSPKKSVSARSLRNSASVQVQVASSGRPKLELEDQSVESLVSSPRARAASPRNTSPTSQLAPLDAVQTPTRFSKSFRKPIISSEPRSPL